MSESTLLGRYRLIRQLGAGGLASVHLAQVDGAAGFMRQVAVKLLHPHLKKSRALVDLFIQEARITSTLSHPNIAQVYSLEEEGDQLVMVMEYIEGLDLRQLLDQLSSRQQKLSTDLALFIAMEISGALEHAHAVLPSRARKRQAVIHRDLSPGNVMVSVDGAVKLLDFGVAKTLVGDPAADQVARGKWPYMSPEQVRGEILDGRSDLFSLGSLLYELLTGQQAFSGRTLVDSMRKVERADVPPAPGVEPVVEAILGKLLARQREDRFGDAGVARAAIGNVLLSRGSSSANRALAELLFGFQDQGENEFEDEPETTVLPGQVVAKMGPPGKTPGSLGPLTAGPAKPGPLTTGPAKPGAVGAGANKPGPAKPGPATPLPPPRSPFVPSAQPSLAPDDLDQVTLPPLSPAEKASSREAGSWETDQQEDPTVVSEDVPGPSPGGPLWSALHGLPDDEVPELASVVPSKPQPAASSPAPPADELATPWPQPQAKPAATAAPWPQPEAKPAAAAAPWPDHALAADPGPASLTPGRHGTTPIRQKSSRASRSLLVITLAILAALIASLAILIAIKQRQGLRKSGPQDPPKTASAEEPTRESARSKEGKDPEGTMAREQARQARPMGHVEPGAASPGAPDAGPARIASADAGAERQATPGSRPGEATRPDASPPSPPDAMEPTAPAPDMGAAPPSDPMAGAEAPIGRPPRGAPRTGQLDIRSKPKGAYVLANGRLMGKTPLRIDHRPGKKLQVTLSLQGRAVYRTPIWMPPGSGRRLDVILPFITKPIYLAKPGRTGLKVLCEGEGPNRVYLDSRDTGYDCPTPPLAVQPVGHSVSVFFGRSQRTVWKQFRPKAGIVNELLMKE